MNREWMKHVATRTDGPGRITLRGFFGGFPIVLGGAEALPGN